MITFRHLATRLRSERGDADPILTIVSMFVSALIAASVLATMVIIIQYGGNFVTEQIRSATLATAQKAWAQDAANASQVFIWDGSKSTFYEEPGYRPGVYVPRADDKSNLCRKSVWTVTGGTITNVVQKFSQARCDLIDNGAGGLKADLSIAALSSVKAVTLAGLSNSASIVAVNAADRDLHYVAGVEVGLATASAAPSTNTRASWWRDYEWAYPEPERINLVGKITLPVAGIRPAALRGDTSIVPTREGSTVTTPETLPVETVYDPAPVTNLLVTRSSTAGAVFGGGREGINVQFGGVSCGPYSTRYDVSWATTTVGAVASRTASSETFDAPLPIDLDKIANGAVGEVTVVASCPTSTKPATVTQNYTQPIPTPLLTAVAGTPPNVHTLSWPAVTSLAGQYSTDLSRDGGAFVLNTLASPNPTAALTQTISYPLGSTYGVPMGYQVTAVVGPTTSNPSAPKTVLTPWPIVAPVTLTPVSTGLLLTVTSDPASCPAGTHPEYQQQQDLNGAGVTPWTLWASNPVTQYTFGEGDQGVVAGHARCAYNTTQVSDPSTSTGFTWVQPITTTPSPPVTTITDAPNDADPVTPSYPSTGCPVNTTPEYQSRYSINDGATTAWSSWAAAGTAPIAGVLQGGKLILDVRARCVSPYTQGPPGLITTTSWIRPIPAPAAPAVGHDGGGPSPITDNRFLYNTVVCPNVTIPAFLRDWYETGIGPGNDPSWVRSVNMDVSTNWGRDYYYSVHARCESPYTVSGSSPGASTSWQTPILAPSGLSIYLPSSRQTYTYFTVSLNSSCLAGTTPAYDVSPNGGSVSGSFNTYHTSTGTKYYTAYATCQSTYTGRTGPQAGPAYASIYITAPPAPGAPVSVSGIWQSGNTGGGIAKITFSASAGATSYTYGGKLNTTGGSGVYQDNTSTGAGTFFAFSECSTVVYTSGAVRVRAANSSGTSVYNEVLGVPRGPNIAGCG